jgi:oligopeptide transport system substrate-binding protein
LRRIEFPLHASLLALLLPGLLLVGCGVFGSQEEDRQGGREDEETLNINLGASIPDLNSTTLTDTISAGIVNSVNEGLYRLDENEEPVPAQAERVDVSDDGLTYTFTLRDGIRWSNGDPVTSEDFRFAWLRAMSPKTAGQASFILANYIEGGAEFAAGEAGADAVGIRTPDERTLEVTLARPTPYFLGLTAIPTYFPLNKEFVDQQGEAYAQSPDALLYNGPYTLTEFKPNQGVTMRKNRGYWDARNVDIETVDARVVSETDTAVNLYESGELDVIGLSGEYVDRYEDSPEFSSDIAFTTWYLLMNFEDPVMSNASIREAVQRGFDREGLAGTILNDAVPPEGLIPPGMAGPGDRSFREAFGPVGSGYDPEEAARLYRQGARELGREPALSLLVGGEQRDFATYLQSQLTESLGTEVRINQQPFDSRLELTGRGEFQMTAYGWGSIYNDPMTFLELFTTESPFNFSSFSNERYDRLVGEARGEADNERRMRLMAEAERILVDESAAIALAYHQEEARLTKPYLKNVVYHQYGASLELKLWRMERG